MIAPYKGVNIYINHEGKFYCDVVNNSDDFKKKTFHSEKITQIWKAIDNYVSEKIEDGDEFYYIQDYNATIKKLKVVSKVGFKVIFDDGTDSMAYSRKSLYPKEIEETDEFKTILNLSDEYKINNDEINKLYAKNRNLSNEIKNKLLKLKKVKIS